MKVLVVDDEKLLLDLYVEEISTKFPDYHITTAEDGKMAYDLCQENQFDLIITDGRMPNLDGFELAEDLKDDGYSAIVIMITGHHREVSNLNLKEIGIEKVFFKPIDYDEFLNYMSSLDPKK